MSGLSFVPLGVGDAFSARWYSSCLALESGGQWLLVDCPHPIRKMMAEASASAGLAPPLDVDRLLGVVVTHLHADHSSGHEGLGYFAHFVLKRRMPLYAQACVVERLWAGHLAAGMERLLPKVGAPAREMHLEDYFEWRPLEPGTAPVTCGPFQLEVRPTIHHIPTSAVRVEAGGRKLGYSADTAFDETLIEWLARADLVIHETNLGVHTPYEKLAALPADLRARMRLIHYLDTFDQAASVIEPLQQGRRYEV